MTRTTFNPDAVRTARRALGLTPGGAATKAGVSRGTILNIEAARHAPRVDVAARIADALDVPVSAFFIHDRESTTDSTGCGPTRDTATTLPGGAVSPIRQKG